MENKMKHDWKLFSIATSNLENTNLFENSIFKKVVCLRISIQTLYFLTVLPSCHGGFENRDKLCLVLS